MTENPINRWSEAIASLPDKQFFNIMRLYLGEIKTPYNKQRLVSQLATFIRNPENTKSIITLLDSFDVTILTAISTIPSPTQESLISFFSGTYSVTEIYAEVIILTERLLIYKEINPATYKECFKINPLLSDELSKYLNLKLIFPDFQTAFYSMEDVFQINPNILGAFISFLQIKGISCKADGVIKKNDANRLDEIFPGKLKFIQLLMNAFINLSLVTESERSFKLDRNRIEVFAKLPDQQQYALLCAASVSRFSKDGLKKEAQLLLDCLSSIPQTGYNRQTILRLAFLLGSYTDDGNAVAGKSRFSRILEAARMETALSPEQNASILDNMIDSAIEFGLLQKQGKTEDGDEIFISKNETLGSGFSVTQNETLGPGPDVSKVLNIDSTFTVTLLPGLKLSQILPLTSFMLIRKCGIVTEFEITRQSVAACFDLGWTPETLFSLISDYSNYEIPQNLKINITEWYNSFTSAVLYNGYILKVSKDNIEFVERNPNIQKYIKEKLADGIFLLNIPIDTPISEFTDESGLEFLGSVRSSTKKSELTTFPLLRDGHKPMVFERPVTEYNVTSIQDAAKLLEGLKQSLKAREIDAHQKESLMHRISNRMILSQQQLETTAVRTEILEADGMDFSGKIHLIDAAIKEEDLMELQFPSANGDGTFTNMVGHALSISKQPGEAVVRFQIEPTKFIENFLVSKITHIRRLRY